MTTLHVCETYSVLEALILVRGCARMRPPITVICERQRRKKSRFRWISVARSGRDISDILDCLQP